MTSLNIFDLDDTLFYTKAQGYLVKTDGTREKISRGQYHNIVPGPGEHIEYDEYRSVKYFIKNNKAIQSIHDLYQECREKGEDALILTARGRMDSVRQLQQYLQDFHMIDCPVHFSGDLFFNSTKEAKKYCIKKILSVPSLFYDEVNFYDDHAANLDGFLELKSVDQFNHINFCAYIITNGQSKPYETPTSR